MGGRARREVRSLHPRRADQSANARRHDQDRPARLAERHADRHRHAGPCRLSAAGRQSGARARDADRRDQRRAARRRHGAFRPVEPGIHLDRRRQQDRQPHSGRGARALQHPLQRHAHARGACAPKSRRRAAKAAGDAIRWQHRMGAVQLGRVPDDAGPVRRDDLEGAIDRGDRARRRSSRPPAARRTRASSRTIAR